MTDKQKAALEQHLKDYKLTIYELTEREYDDGSTSVYLSTNENEFVEGFDQDGNKPLNWDHELAEITRRRD